MGFKKRTKIGIAASIVLLIALFLVFSYVSQNNLAGIREIIQRKFVLGSLIFFLIEVAAVVIAPVTTLPLTPLASNSLGWFAAFVILVIAGTLGSIIAFLIARKYGKKIVKRFVSIRDIEEAEKLIPRRKVFFSLILLRIVIPLDILSYSLGIFTKMDLRLFSVTTFIGLIPPSFFLAYLGTLPIILQIAGWIVAVIVLVFVLWRITKRGYELKKRKRRK